MSIIKPIEGRSQVHQIQSGQVISDGLTSAVKELVENSLDAHATSIEIRFKNYGLDLLEVSDNGDGISPDNFQSLALKHYTSKLRTYDDLDSVTTYGFRGEALSSLCALSLLTVTTATQDVAPKGSKLEFEISGVLKSTSVTACSKGTTVSVENIFRTLPVRRRELEKNIKRDYAKVLNFLQAYAIVCTGVRFTVVNTVNGKKTTSLNTKANKTTRENISNVFGAKTLLALMSLELDFDLISAPTILRPSDKDNRKVCIEGYISRPIVGEGRQAPDRQMFFVNSRPCNLPQVSRAINEIYKSYNVTQSPFILANMKLDTNSYDVNVSPDKRTILLHDQTSLVETLKVALTELFEKQDQTVPMASHQRAPVFRQLTIERQHSTDSNQNDEETSASSRRQQNQSPDMSISAPDAVSENDGHDDEQEQPSRRLSSFLSLNTINRASAKRTENLSRHGLTFQQKSKISSVLSKRHGEFTDDEEGTGKDNEDHEQEDEELPISKLKTPRKHKDARLIGRSPIGRLRFSPTKGSRSPTIITIGNTTITTSPDHRTGLPSEADQEDKNSDVEKHSRSARNSLPISLTRKLQAFAANGQNPIEQSDIKGSSDDNDSVEEDSEVAMETTSVQHIREIKDANISSDPFVDDPTVENLDKNNDEDYVDPSEQKKKEQQRVDFLIRRAEDEAARPTAKLLERTNNALMNNRKDSTKHLRHTISISINEVKHRNKHSRATSNSSRQFQERTKPLVSVEEAIESDATIAEERLSLTIFKSDFAKMRIIGQFNLGFILAIKKSGDAKDMFIIDQHASDEKYNFERLQAETIVQNQPLVRPKVLDLTAMEELVVMDNLETFKRNGFVIEVDDDAMTGARCQLVSLPMSKGVIFDAKDLEELIHLVHQNPNDVTVRPSKVRSMFAMRACRSSIMIGKTLSFKTMAEVVGHMGHLDKPWNCPHGRPTMRHVKDLGQIQAWTGDEQPIDWEDERCAWLVYGQDGDEDNDDNDDGGGSGDEEGIGQESRREDEEMYSDV